MKIIKKDFVSEDTESYCGTGRKLSSGTAYYMQDENGLIHYGGRHCAEMHGTNDIKDVPDLTKSLVSLASPHSGTGTGTKADTESSEQKKSLAIAYLLLREELLHDFNIKNISISCKTLRNYYNTYQQTGDLSNKEVNHILNIELHATNKINKRLSLKNLSTCHAYNFILKRVRSILNNKNNKQGILFVDSLQEFLHSNCYLSQKQIHGLNQWIQYLPHDLKNAKLKNFD